MQYPSDPKRFEPTMRPGQGNHHALALVFDAENNLLLRVSADAPVVPEAGEFTALPPPELCLHIGIIDGKDCETWQVAGVPDGFVAMHLRDALRLLAPEWYNPVSRAAELLFWHRKTSFCGSCGAAMRLDVNGEPAKNCPSCGNMNYPWLSPAVITAVTRGDQILLAANRKFRPGLYSVVAGFVETGESLEDAVRRETMEETGIAVKNIRYFGSQSWPFPHSLMVGFTAEYESGEVTPDGEEIIDAQWFDRENLPDLPSRPSIAHDLIHAYINRKID